MESIELDHRYVIYPEYKDVSLLITSSKIRTLSDNSRNKSTERRVTTKEGLMKEMPV